MQLQFLGAGIDSVVFKKGDKDRVIKFYGYDPKMDRVIRDDVGMINLRKLKFYHKLHNCGAGVIFEEDVNGSEITLEGLNFAVRRITFEILHLDTSRIGRATRFDKNFLQDRFHDKHFIVSEVDYVGGQTLEEFRQSSIGNEMAKLIGRIISKRLVKIYEGTQIAKRINHGLEAWGQSLSLNNMKVYTENGRIHIIVTDTLNCIGSLIPYLN